MLETQNQLLHLRREKVKNFFIYFFYKFTVQIYAPQSHKENKRLILNILKNKLCALCDSVVNVYGGIIFYSKKLKIKYL
jgi:hypothetical protein